MALEIRLLTPADIDLLDHVAKDVFDGRLNPSSSAAFLRDRHHHIVVAIDDGMIVGFASALHYVHPDNAPELWINEVGIGPDHRSRGIERLRSVNCWPWVGGLAAPRRGCSLSRTIERQGHCAARYEASRHRRS